MSMLNGRKVNKTGRSIGARKSNKRTKIDGQFAPRLIEMLESYAFRVLNLSAHRILDRLEIELGHHGGADNGHLPCTYKHFEEYGIDREAIAPAIRECVALGFVEITEHGGGGNAEFRTPNLYRLTYRPTMGDPTHEWREIKTMEQAELLKQNARAEKQKAAPEKPTAPPRKTRAENRYLPPRKTRGAVPPRKTRAASISPGDTPTEDPFGALAPVCESGLSACAGTDRRLAWSEPKVWEPYGDFRSSDGTVRITAREIFELEEDWPHLRAAGARAHIKQLMTWATRCVPPADRRTAILFAAGNRGHNMWTDERARNETGRAPGEAMVSGEPNRGRHKRHARPRS